ncbi:hypothetical protein O181_090994 [Austropuccinia psidii MF-1]|uniref:Uncharacterized protein n=1 Tax=Austropuccinia psidii MF-1 TaxID=1389203 RepID=A0A9Q3IWH8_9BASI|nr:hypothetical protein [Austropuccinia psidii MF-1]
MLTVPSYLESLETKKETEKHINELLEIGLISKIGHNEIVEVTKLDLITWENGKFRLGGDFRALKSYTKKDRYSIARIRFALEKISKSNLIKSLDCMKSFHKNGV